MSVYKYSDLQRSPRLRDSAVYKLESGLYSEKEKVSDLEIIAKKYENAIFTLDSAYFYYGLTDNIPTHYHLATKKRARKINNLKVKQTYSVDDYFSIGDSSHLYNDIRLRIYDKERMLIELVRNKNKMAYDMYKEIVNNYRGITDQLNFLKLQEYLKVFKNGDKLLKMIQEEVL